MHDQAVFTHIDQLTSLTVRIDDNRMSTRDISAAIKKLADDLLAAASEASPAEVSRVRRLAALLRWGKIVIPNPEEKTDFGQLSEPPMKSEPRPARDHYHPVAEIDPVIPAKSKRVKPAKVILGRNEERTDLEYDS